MTPLQKMAYDILCKISDTGDALEKVNREMSNIFDTDFPPRVSLMPSKIHENIVSLIGKILEPGAGEHNIAAYFLYEAKGMKNGGYIKLKDGREYTIQTLEDVRKYVEETT